MIASRYKIGQIMKKYSLVSNYTVAQYKAGKNKCNGDKIANVVDREFDNREKLGSIAELN